MKKISMSLVCCLVIVSATNCGRKWETSGWFGRASDEEKRKTYVDEVIEPAIVAELYTLQKKQIRADEEARIWQEDGVLSLKDEMISECRTLSAGAKKDMIELHKRGKSIASGQTKPDKLSVGAQHRLRENIIKYEKEFTDFYGITPKEVEAFMGKERKPSGAFFSSLEEEGTAEEPSLWKRISNWFK